MNACSRADAHTRVGAFARFFQNDRSFSGIHGRESFHVPCNPAPPSLTTLTGALEPSTEGLSKYQIRVGPTRCREADVARLARKALDMGFIGIARMFAIARAFMGRAANELVLFELDGKANLPPGNTYWHSQAIENHRINNRPSVTIVLRSRS